MGRLFLIRHGQTDSNNGKQFQGSMDNPLNELGREQARQMAEYMSRFKLDAIYCSSLQRAVMTAEPLAHLQELKYEPMDLLREVSFGDWEGLSFTKLFRDQPKEMETFMERPGDFTPPGGESFAQAQERCDEALRQILAKEGNDKNIALVSHGGIIRLQICSFLGIPLNNLWKMAVFNASVTTVANVDGNFMLEIINNNNFLQADSGQKTVSIV